MGVDKHGLCCRFYLNENRFTLALSGRKARRKQSAFTKEAIYHCALKFRFLIRQEAKWIKAAPASMELDQINPYIVQFLCMPRNLYRLASRCWDVSSFQFFLPLFCLLSCANGPQLHLFPTGVFTDKCNTKCIHMVASWTQKSSSSNLVAHPNSGSVSNGGDVLNFHPNIVYMIASRAVLFYLSKLSIDNQRDCYLYFF